MRTSTKVTTAIAALLGSYVGYTTAGIGGSLVWAVLWGVGGLLVGRAIVSTAGLVSRFWKVALAIALFVTAVVLTWGLRL